MSHKESLKKQKVRVMILAGSRDFGRCPIASRLPTALWPVASMPVLEHLLRNLSRQGVKEAVICSNGDASLLQRTITETNSMKLKFLDEPLPVGTAGSIRDAVDGETDALLLVFPASIVSPPKIDVLLKAHHNSQADLTVIFNPAYENGEATGEPAGIYICETSVIEHIPKESYFDIKEGLIPEILRVGKTVHMAILQNHVGNFRDWQGYLNAIGNYLENEPKLNTNLKPYTHSNSRPIWMATNTSIDPSARIYGPAVIMEGAQIAKNAVILGPTIVGQNVSISENSIVVNSVLWDNAQVGKSCEIQKCLVGNSADIPDDSIVAEQTIPYKQKTILQTSVNKTLRFVNNKASEVQPLLQQYLGKINKLTDWSTANLGQNVFAWLGNSIVLIAFLWAYWPGIVDLWNLWQRSDEYSSGLLVPFLAIYILWSRRNDIAQCRIRPCVWGLFAFIMAQGLRYFGLFFMYGSAERLSIVLSTAALVLFLFGWQLFRKVSMVLLFLCLMLPWPNRVQAAIAIPLQNWATSSAVFCLEMIGYEIIQEGNIIHIGDATVAIAEACNGLRMITAFFVITGLVVLLVRRKWWEKLLVFASSIPIALLCNTVRLTITSIAFTMLSGQRWEQIFHDFGGYAMMPLALAVVVLELWFLTKLITLPIEKKVVLANK